MYSVTCPRCSGSAFEYEGSNLLVGQKIDLKSIHGAEWKESTIPCCHICSYAFGPNDFKENRFKQITPTKLPSDASNAEQQVTAPPTVNFPTSSQRVFQKVWEHFKNVLDSANR